MEPAKISTSSMKNSEFRPHRSYASRGSLKLSRFASSVGASRGAEDYTNGNNLDGVAPSAKHERSSHLSDKPNSSNRRDHRTYEKEYTPVDRIHCSGLLFPSGGNMDGMLKKHEKQVQQAVRKAGFDKTKPRKSYGDNGPMESLLHHGTKAR